MAPVAALLLAFATAAFSVGAQQPPDNSPDNPPDSPPVVHLPGSHPQPSGDADSSPVVPFPGSGSVSSGAVDPIARENAAKFAEVTGLRRRLEENFPKTMQSALDEMRRRYPNLDPRFVAEWEKRMRVQFDPDDYVAVFIHVYAEHYTASELEEMIQAVRARQNSKPVTISPHLAEKIRASDIDVQSEVMGGFAEIGARKGGEIGREIGMEHPDWVKSLIPATSAAAK